MKDPDTMQHDKGATNERPVNDRGNFGICGEDFISHKITDRFRDANKDSEGKAASD